VKRLVALWLAWFVPATALATGLLGAAYELIAAPSGFFGFSMGASAWLFLGALYGGAWALSLALPYALGLWVWAKLAAYFADIDTTRPRIVIGMVVWSLPQALCIGVATEPPVFVIAWIAVALGLSLPRLVVRALRPGVFS
jgi:hypothetical protein